MSSTTLTGPTSNIFALEKDVLSNLNNFNSLYANYVNCTLKKSTTNTTSCPSSEVTLETVNYAYDATKNSIAALQTALGSLSPTNGGPTPSQYDTSYNAIMGQYEQMVKNRVEIDTKLRELNNINGASSDFYEKQYISTAYTKILLTVLATTVAYYVFMKLRK
jgi:hypothetical protein